MSNPYQEALGATLIERTFRERIVLVGVTMGGQTDDETEEGLDELSLLIDTAGADEAARITQRRDSPDSTFYIGKGKVDELKEVCLALDVDTVVFDNELSPGQQYNLEKALGRTARSSGAAIGPRSADTGSNLSIRAASVIAAVSPTNGSDPVINSSSVKASE